MDDKTFEHLKFLSGGSGFVLVSCDDLRQALRLESYRRLLDKESVGVSWGESLEDAYLDGTYKDSY